MLEKSESPEKKTLVTGLFEVFRYFIVYQYIKKTFREKRVGVHAGWKINPLGKNMFCKNWKSPCVFRVMSL